MKVVSIPLTATNALDVADDDVLAAFDKAIAEQTAALNELKAAGAHEKDGDYKVLAGLLGQTRYAKSQLIANRAAAWRKGYEPEGLFSDKGTPAAQPPEPEPEEWDSIIYDDASGSWVPYNFKLHKRVPL